MAKDVFVRAILLSGGLSQRFGSPKALVTKAGQPLVVDRYRMLQGVDPAPLVLAGGLAAETQRLLPEARVISDPQGGPVRALSSLQLHGLHLIIPVDMPQLEASDLRAFVEAARGPSILGLAPATLPCILRLPLDLKVGRSLKSQLFQQNAAHLLPTGIPQNRLAHFNTPEAWRTLGGS